MCIIMTIGFMVAGFIYGNENFFLIAAVFGIGSAIELATSRIVTAIKEASTSRAIEDAVRSAFKKTP